MASELTHACDACGGTGTERGITYFRDRETGRSLHTVCPVCLGAGRISDRMPASDALADAETLRLVSARATTVDCWVSLLAIADRGQRALEQSWPSSAKKYAAQAARAAFRAVPGLRGE